MLRTELMTIQLRVECSLLKGYAESRKKYQTQLLHCCDCFTVIIASEWSLFDMIWLDWSAEIRINTV